MFRSSIRVIAMIAITQVVPMANAAIINWDIDPSASFIRLALPDQTLTVDGITATIRLRDAGSNNNWTDAGGRRAFIDGTIASQYVTNGFGVQTVDFLGGLHNIFALEQTQLRPNPAQFNPGLANGDNPDGQYSGTGTAPAALGARVRATVFITLDAAFLAFRDVFFDYDSPVLNLGLGGAGSIASNSTQFTISSANLDVDGISIPIAGQLIPDILNEPLPSIGFLTNTGTGSITNLGGLNRRLDLAINIPLSVDVEGITVTGSVTGNLRAFAQVPEASTLMMLGVAGLAGIPLIYRRVRSR